MTSTPLIDVDDSAEFLDRTDGLNMYSMGMEVRHGSMEAKRGSIRRPCSTDPFLLHEQVRDHTFLSSSHQYMMMNVVDHVKPGGHPMNIRPK